MSKKMVYFNATKQIETVTIHYNEKLDGVFVNEVAGHIKDIAKKMKGVDLKNPRDFYEIQVFVYPSKQLFYKVFSGEIEKRFYKRKRSLEDLYLVLDSEGNIHIVSPRGMSPEKVEALKKILVMKILGEYMEEKQKIAAEKMLKDALKPKKEEIEEVIEEDVEETLEDAEEIEEQDTEEQELTEEELEDLILIEEAIEEVDDEIETPLEDDEEIEEQDTEEQESLTGVIHAKDGDYAKEQSDSKEKIEIKTDAQEWLSIGWLAYIRGKLKREKDIKSFADHVSKNGVVKLSKLKNSTLLDNYNYSEEYACALVEYVITTYGKDKFIEYYNSPKDIRGVFGVSEKAFNSDVKAFIYSKYSVGEMKMEMDTRSLTDITQIRLYNAGGAEINEAVKEVPQIEVPH